MELDQFAPLVLPHTATMARVAAAIVGVADAEDAAQEALVRAWRAWPDLREATAARSWLLRITVNICRTWRARDHASQQVALDLLDAETLEVGPLITGEAVGAESHASVLDLRQAILTLSDDLRLIVALRFYAGMDSTAIGELLGEVPATVRSRLRRALIQLRETLDPATSPGQTPSGAPTDAQPKILRKGA